MIATSTDKALTLHQPWASAIIAGPKRIENRPWAPPRELLGRRFWIHAGLTYDVQGALFCEARGFRAIEAQTPRGVILGSVRLAGYWTPGTTGATRLVTGDGGRPTPAQVDAALVGGWMFGPFGWMLLDPKPLRTPVACRGLQKLWSLPAAVRAAIEAQGGAR